MYTRKFITLVVSCIGIISIVFAFQNCAEDVQIEKYTTTSPSTTSTPEPEPAPAPAPTPTPTPPPKPPEPVGTAPVITVAPVNRLVTFQSAFELTVTATGKPMTYQWYKNGSAISGATNSSLIFSSAVESDSGNYAVAISNQFGTTRSNPIDVVVNRNPDQYPPAISIGIKDTHAVAYLLAGIANPSVVSFNVSATSVTPITYKWYYKAKNKSEVPVAGNNSPTLSINVLNAAYYGGLAGGDYRVVVSNSFGSVESKAKFTLGIDF